MNLEPHVHTPTLIHEELGPMWSRRSTWWLVYGNVRVSISHKENPYDWPVAKLEKELARHLKTAVEVHDRGTAKAKRRIEGERCANAMLEAWASRWQKDRWASGQ